MLKLTLFPGKDSYVYEIKDPVLSISADPDLVSVLCNNGKTFTYSGNYLLESWINTEPTRDQPCAK